jgi:hypothetical protein
MTCGSCRQILNRSRSSGGCTGGRGDAGDQQSSLDAMGSCRRASLAWLQLAVQGGAAKTGGEEGGIEEEGWRSREDAISWVPGQETGAICSMEASRF